MYGPSVKQDSHELKWKKLSAITYSTDKKMRLTYDVKSNSWNLNSAGKQTTKSSGPFFRIQTAKSTNHSGHST